MRTIYLDYNATTPLDPAVRATMLPFLDEVWGNPSSVHHVGRRARAFLDEARERAATVLGGKPSEIVFTSGGTESINLAILGTARKLRDKGRHLVTTQIEHHAVLHCFDYLEKYEGFEVTRLPVSRDGVLDPSQVRKALRAETVLVSVMAANNETGTLQPVAEIGEICRSNNVKFHTDAVQWFGKEPFSSIAQFNADLVSICAHKFHGPKGAGALFIKSPLQPLAVAMGGAHENERRAGTENLATIAGLVAAMERFLKPPVFPTQQLAQLTKSLTQTIQNISGAQIVASNAPRLANTVSMVVEGADSIALLAGLDLEEICASSGSACSAGSLQPSHVIEALGFSRELANSLVRFSLGRETTKDQIERVKEVLPGVIARVQPC